MGFLSETAAMLHKEIRLEWKQKFALNGLLLYSLTMVFVISMVHRGGMSPMSWNVTFWVILLFVAVNAIAKSFLGESTGQNLYVYTLASPYSILAAKLIYNCLLMTGIAFVTFGFFMLFSNKIVIQDPLRYLVFVFFGAWGFAANLTLVSALSAQARNRSTLLAVLGFPLLIPQLLTLIQGCTQALLGTPWSESLPHLAFSLGFVVIIALVSFILFPFLWKE